MTSFIEQIVEGFGNLSSIMQAGLAEVRSKDETTRNLLKAINKEEIDLLEELKQLAKTNPDFDEEPLKARAQHLISRRRDVSLILDDQNKFSIGIYHHLDQKIKDFDVSSKGIVHLFPDSGNTLETDETRRKKKRRSSNSRTLMNSDSQVRPEDERLDTLSVFDTVLYCTCRRPDFGQKMVACSNDECPISHEWFHYGCVGLTEDWLQNECDWFCSMCRDPSSSFVCRDLSKPPLADSTAIASAAIDWKDAL